MRVTIASVSSHLVVRPRRFWKIKEKKMEKKINNDLAIVASQYLEGRFMTLPSQNVNTAYDNYDVTRRGSTPSPNDI